MLQINVGLVDTTGTVNPETMTAAAAALNVQVTRDLPQYWSISATVSYLTDPHKIPQGTWPVQLVKSLPPGEGGFHMTKHNQPYAKVIVTPGSNEWTIDASHETLEMLVDPSGNRLQVSTAMAVAGGQIKESAGQFEYLVETCDPCEADEFAYEINGISVSDFLTPHFYDLDPTADARYSFTGAIKAPRQVLKGGYISWVDPQTHEMQQILWVDPNKPPQEHNLGLASGSSLRAFVEMYTWKKVHDNRRAASEPVLTKRKAHRAHAERDAQARAKFYI